MILEQGKAAEVILDGVDESINMGIDAGSTAVLMDILSQGLYKDPIGSIVREWTSNALDSHVEAGVDEPVIVAIQKDDTYNWWFSVQDFGVGISPDRLQNIISKYAASTKRNTNTMLGAFGLGLKSGLSYSDSFIFSTNYN
jgi:HSP90 family molecular chaperone